MNTAEQLAAMDTRLIEEALMRCRARAEADETASRVHRVCEEAIEAQGWARSRVRERKGIA